MQGWNLTSELSETFRPMHLLLAPPESLSCSKRLADGLNCAAHRCKPFKTTKADGTFSLKIILMWLLIPSWLLNQGALVCVGFIPTGFVFRTATRVLPSSHGDILTRFYDNDESNEHHTVKVKPLGMVKWNEVGPGIEAAGDKIKKGLEAFGKDESAVGDKISGLGDKLKEGLIEGLRSIKEAMIAVSIIVSSVKSAIFLLNYNNKIYKAFGGMMMVAMISCLVVWRENISHLFSFKKR